jgi:hypothetical protein
MHRPLKWTCDCTLGVESACSHCGTVSVFEESNYVLDLHVSSQEGFLMGAKGEN